MHSEHSGARIEGQLSPAGSAEPCTPRNPKHINGLGPYSLVIMDLMRVRALIGAVRVAKPVRQTPVGVGGGEGSHSLPQSSKEVFS